MAKTKIIEAACNFCGNVTKMELTGESGDHFQENTVWAKCRKCKQTMLVDLDNPGKEEVPTVEDIDSADSRQYSPKESYKIGESIYHKGFDDFGIIKSKAILGNGKDSISVEFQNVGLKRLITTQTT